MLDIREVIEYMIKNQCTIREASKQFGIPKSTLHSKIHRIMPILPKEIVNPLEKLLKKNYNNRYINGGESFSNKYKGKPRKEIWKDSEDCLCKD